MASLNSSSFDIARQRQLREYEELMRKQHGEAWVPPTKAAPTPPPRTNRKLLLLLEKPR